MSLPLNSTARRAGMCGGATPAGPSRPGSACLATTRPSIHRSAGCVGGLACGLPTGCRSVNCRAPTGAAARRRRVGRSGRPAVVAPAGLLARRAVIGPSAGGPASRSSSQRRVECAAATPRNRRPDGARRAAASPCRSNSRSARSQRQDVAPLLLEGVRLLLRAEGDGSAATQPTADGAIALIAGRRVLLSIGSRSNHADRRRLARRRFVGIPQLRPPTRGIGAWLECRSSSGRPSAC